MNFEAWGALLYAAVAVLSLLNGVPTLAAFAAFCCGMMLAMFMVIKGWTIYHDPAANTSGIQKGGT